MVKGTFPPHDAKVMMQGKVVSVVGSGRSRRWRVQFDNPAVTHDLHARSLVVVGQAVSSDNSSSSSSTSPPPSDASDDSLHSAQSQHSLHSAPPNNALLTPHGLLWSKVSVVTDDFQSLPRPSFKVRFTNDVPLVDIQPWMWFSAMFPTHHVDTWLEHTNREATRLSIDLFSRADFMRALGVLFAMCVVDLGSRRDYFSTDSPGDVFPRPKLGRYGMGCHRFENFLRCLRFCATPAQPNPWAQVDSLIDAFNDTREKRVTPSWRLCVDEKTSWYFPAKRFVDDAVPHLTKIVRKPKRSSMELKDVTCGQSRVCMRLELQKGKDAMATAEFASTYNAGTACLLRLTKPWTNTGRLVVGDSAFASVQTATAALERGLHFTGVVKTATRMFPMAHMRGVDLPARGDHEVYVARPSTDVQLLGVVWNGGKQRKMFVSTRGVTTLAAEPAKRLRYVNVGDGTSTTVERVTPWPQLVRDYFETANAGDVNNHYRQESLGLEYAWGTHTFWHRVTATVFGTCLTDAFLAYRAVPYRPSSLTFREFVTDVAQSLLTVNTCGEVVPMSFGTRKRARPEIESASEVTSDKHDLCLLSGSVEVSGAGEGKKVQRKCRVCKSKCSYFCPKCSSVQKGVFFGLCGPGTSRGLECYRKHKE